ncbi:MAG TPA: VWA domain-containing protein [Vicinamibacterales bacterium]|nr:VWA domain-containing protein [Vicinamibacterales bacterium]
MRFRRFAVAAGLVYLTSGPAASVQGTGQGQQQPPPPTSQKPVFTSAVDVVSVDVTVVDKYGKPVEDLGRNDFILTVDGQPRKIASAQFVAMHRDALPSAGVALPASSLPDFSTNTVQEGKLIAIVIDRGNIAPVRSRDVLAAASRFVERLDPADRVALFSIPQGPAIDFTTDHRAIASALQRIDGQGDSKQGVKNIGVADALSFERRNDFAMEQVLLRECGQIPPDGPGASETRMCRNMVTEEANIVSTYAHERARNTMNGLIGILQRLGSSETPKTLVLVSEGMVIDNERRIVQGFGRAAAAAHVTLYSLKPESSESTAAQARMAANPVRDRSIKEEGLQYVSSVGGGEMFRVIADPDFAFARVASELSGYYLLGFEPEAGDRDGRSHGISVKVNRDDVSVRSRQEFGVGLSKGKSGKETVTDLLRSAVPATTLPVMVTTYMFQDPGSLKVRVLVAMDVDRPADPKEKFSVGMVLVDENGNSGASFFHPALAPSPQSPPGTQRFFATLLTDPGAYKLRVAVADSSGSSGSVERNVRAYMRRLGPFRVSDLMLGAQTPGGGAAAIVPTVTGQTTGDTLHAYLELFAENAAMYDRAAVLLEIGASADAPALQSAAAHVQANDTDPRSRAIGVAIPIGSLAPGTYVARAVIVVDGQKAGTITRGFQVVR